MRPVDIFCAILVAVIWGLGFIASRLALDELSPSMMTTASGLNASAASTV